MHTHEAHACETHARDIHAYEMHAYEVYPREVHTYEVHAYEVYLHRNHSGPPHHHTACHSAPQRVEWLGTLKIKNFLNIAHLIGAYLMGMHLTDVCLMGVYLTGVSPVLLTPRAALWVTTLKFRG
jgi:hypothetical protein